MSSSPAAIASAPEPLSVSAVLRIPVMRRLWMAQIVSVFGDFLALFAVINYLTFQLNAKPEQVTNLQIAYTLPIAVLGILAGVFVDRWPLKPTMVTSDYMRAGLCLLLPLARHIWQFYAILAVISIFSSFFGPAQGVALRSAVPLHGLRAAQGLMQQVMFGMRIVGPALAGFCYTELGAKVCYFGDAASFVASGTLIASLAISRKLYTPAIGAEVATEVDATAAPAPAPVPAPPSTGFASILPDMKQGLSFIFHQSSVLFVILALSAAMFIIGCFAPLTAIYVRDSVHASTKVYSFISGAIGLGMFGGVTLLNAAGKKLKSTTLVFAGLPGIAVGLVLLTLLPHVWSAILANLVIGTSVGCIVVPANVLIQQETPPQLMGRVGSTMMSMVFGSQIVGLVFSGLLADRIGVRHVFAVCALLLATLTIGGYSFLRPKAPAPVAA